MGTVAAIAGAMAGFFALVMFLYKRHDGPAASEARHEEGLADDLEAFDEALGDTDENALTGSYSDLYNMVDIRLRSRAGDNNCG